MNLKQQRNYATDIIKFIAVLFITNSHYIPLYQEVNPSFATLGVHGNALFFFASGYVLTLGKSVNETSFKDWYKKRINRIWPTFIVWAIFASLVFKTNITWENILIAKGYWFIQCIMISYILLFIIMKYQKKYINKYMLGSIIITVLYFLVMPQSSGSIYHSNLHWVCYSPSMMLGLYLGTHTQKCKSPFLKMGLSFVLYFIIMNFGKGKTDFLYYTQILAIIPLNTFIYYLFIWLSNQKLDEFASKKFIWKPIYWIASLSLEIYVVQFSIITDKFNFLFPLNTIIVFSLIVITAYSLRICTNLFKQTFSVESYSIRNALTI